MLTQISLKNFKCFKNKTSFPLGKFNLLTGVNGRGKSSLLQSLLLMRQTVEHNPNSNKILLNGTCVELGTFNDVRNSDNPTDMPIEMEFTIDYEHIGNIAFHLILKSGANSRILETVILNVNSHKILRLEFDDKESTEIDFRPRNETDWFIGYGEAVSYIGTRNFFPNKSVLMDSDFLCTFSDIFPIHTIHYIAADRIGPRNYYKQENLGSFLNTSPTGENTATILALWGEREVEDKLYMGKDAATLIQQTEEWLNYIFDGAKVTIKAERDVVHISYNTNQKEHRYRPSNVGFGYSYILPIVVSGLIAGDGEILIVENPEAHLHPKAQNRLTLFLAQVASCGVQVFVETHSEHILNGLRIASINENIALSNKDVSVLYFQDNDKEPFVSIPIDEKGGIDDWPEGFFDQNDKDFKLLFGF